jgi:hypothetical protein
LRRGFFSPLRVVGPLAFFVVFAVVTLDVVFLDVVFLDVVFLDVVFLDVVFLGAVFLAVVFLAVVFLAIFLKVFLVAVFLLVAAFFVGRFAVTFFVDFFREAAVPVALFFVAGFLRVDEDRVAVFFRFEVVFFEAAVAPRAGAFLRTAAREPERLVLDVFFLAGFLATGAFPVTVRIENATRDPG